MPTDYNPTIRTYNQIAHQYAERRKDRSAISIHLTRFVDLIKEQGLVELPVIDIGCGPGFDTAAMSKEGLHSIGLDLSWGMLKMGMLSYPISFLMADMRNLPMSETVAGLWCCASLLHLSRPDMPKVLEEFTRVLVPDGVLYLSVKEGEGQRWSSTTAGEPGPRLFTYWNSSDLDRLIDGAGFRIVHSSTESSSEGTMWLTRFATRARQ